jgi:ribosomal protein S18 acetylase RimI-like enzyme
MPEVRRCRPSERDAALRIVLAAFGTDPLLRWVWPSDARYDACAPAFFGLLLDLRLEGGEVWVATDSDVDDLGSVAMWDPPGGIYRQPPEHRWTAVQAAFTPAERAAWKSYDEAMGVAESAGPHWYLGVLATTPGRQGSGLGRAVTAPMLAAADRTGLPAYLETASTTNVAIYQRLGFTVEREAELPGSPRCWLMRRDPRPAGQPDRQQSRESEEAR